jgi:hypothetical protein
MRFSGDGNFYHGGYQGFWWSATPFDITNNDIFSCYLLSGMDLLNRNYSYFDKNNGFSVRLIRD